MVHEILTAAGFILGKTYWRTRFAKPPAETYAVYMDDVTADGPDGINRIFIHDITVEVYEPYPDEEREAALEAALNAAGRAWTKQDRYWLQEEQRYQTIYEFSHIEKRRD